MSNFAMLTQHILNASKHGKKHPMYSEKGKACWEKKNTNWNKLFYPASDFFSKDNI